VIGPLRAPLSVCHPERSEGSAFVFVMSELAVMNFSRFHSFTVPGGGGVPVVGVKYLERVLYPAFWYRKGHVRKLQAGAGYGRGPRSPGLHTLVSFHSEPARGNVLQMRVISGLAVILRLRTPPCAVILTRSGRICGCSSRHSQGSYARIRCHRCTRIAISHTSWRAAATPSTSA